MKNTASTSLRVTRRIFAALALSSVIFTFLSWRYGRLELALGPAHLTITFGAKPVVLTLILIAMGLAFGLRGVEICFALGRMIRTAVFRKIMLSLVGLGVFFGGTELILRMIGFEATLPAIVVRGKSIDVNSDQFMIDDPELLWKLNPGAVYRGATVNSMGFFGREFDREKPPETVRVMCLGDSCTAQGNPPYSGFLHQRLQEEPPTAASWECINLGVHGYASVQGLRQFQIWGKDLNPDIVTIYYGWNDHWLGEAHVSDQLAWGMGRFSADIVKPLKSTRVFQAMIHMLKPPHRRARSSNDSDAMVIRVPVDEYRWTLERLVHEIRGIGAVPILITAPRGERLTHLLVKNGQTRDLDEALMLHDEYVALTRNVAEKLDVELLDLAAIFSNSESSNLFSSDGIHLEETGRRRIADELYGLLLRMTVEGTIAQ